MVDRDGNAVVIHRGEEPRKIRNIAHMKKLNGCPETSQGQTMTSIPVGNRDGEREPTVSIPVNVGTSDEERDLTVSNPVTVESSGGECARVFLTRFNKIATQGAPQTAVDKEANSVSRVYSYYSKFNLCLFYV